jgi:hypothetical protein
MSSTSMAATRRSRKRWKIPGIDVLIGGGDFTTAGTLTRRSEARAMDEIGPSRIVNPGPVAAGHYALVEIDAEVEVQLDH